MSETSRRPEPAPVPAEESAGPPEVVVLVGLQASGKSTLFRWPRDSTGCSRSSRTGRAAFVSGRWRG